MKPFRFVEAESVTGAITLLETQYVPTKLIAGGTNLIGEIKEGIASPATLVSLLKVRDLEGIASTREGLQLGALTIVAELETPPDIANRYSVLAQAASSVATPQIRNIATLGGNLCQRPRCWYYRSSLFDCRKKGGDTCFAEDGASKYHAILGGVDCYIVHPSDLAVALIALRARVTISGPDGSRTLPLESFFVSPESDMMGETSLEPSEILTLVSVPQTSPHHCSIYLKAKERQAYDFALASVALAVELSEGFVHDALIVLGGVAPVPLRVPHAEDALKGRSVEQVDPGAVGELAVRGAQPLKDNGFKVPLTSSLVSRAVRTLLEGADHSVSGSNASPRVTGQ